jgi:hypothetical protein
MPKKFPFKDFNETPLPIVDLYYVLEASCIKKEKVISFFLENLDLKCSNFSKNVAKSP